MEKIIILDYSTGKVHVFDYDSNIYDDYEAFYEDMNKLSVFAFKNSQCSCMIVDELDITVH